MAASAIAFLAISKLATLSAPTIIWHNAKRQVVGASVEAADDDGVVDIFVDCTKDTWVEEESNKIRFKLL